MITFLIIIKKMHLLFSKDFFKNSSNLLHLQWIPIREDIKVQKPINISKFWMDFSQILTESAYGDHLHMIQFW